MLKSIEKILLLGYNILDIVFEHKKTKGSVILKKKILSITLVAAILMSVFSVGMFSVSAAKKIVGNKVTFNMSGSSTKGLPEGTDAADYIAEKKDSFERKVDQLAYGGTGEGKVDGSIPDDGTVVVSAHEFFKDTNYTPVDSMAKALMEVKAGTADLAIVDSVCALAMVGEGTDYDDLVVNLDNNFGEQEYGIAFRKGSDMAAMVNDTINELYADGTVASIAEKYGLSEILVSR